jgi:hypothetical protein
VEVRFARPAFRLRFVPPIPRPEAPDKKPQRYFQPVGSAPQLYLPPRAWAARTDASVQLLGTEGEKKSAKADQEGLACFGLGGLWNWLMGGAPIEALDAIEWYSREVLLVPDARVWLKPELLFAVYALGRELVGRGASVRALKLPLGPEGAEVALDDFLCAHPETSAATIEALPHIALNKPPLDRFKARWQQWRKHKRAEADGTVEAAGPSGIEIITESATTRAIHPAQDVADGVLIYGFQAAASAPLALVTSTRHAYTVDQLPPSVQLRHQDPGRCALSKEGALQWLVESARGSVVATLDALVAFFLRYIVFPDPRAALLCAAWALMTWCYRVVDLVPYLAIHAPGQRAGKSRLLECVQLVSFNAAPITTAPTETQLYREVEQTGGAQFFDEVENLTGDKERWAAFIGSLNAGFQQGRVATRYEKQGEKMVPRQYDIFAPRALAGIGRLKNTLADRCLFVRLQRKHVREKVTRFTRRAYKLQVRSLRDQAALSCLTWIGRIEGAVDDAARVLTAANVDDRLEDVLIPLVALTLSADTEDGGTRTRTLITLAQALGRARQEEAAMDRAAEVVEVLMATYEGRAEDPGAWVMTPRDTHKDKAPVIKVTPEDLLRVFQARFGADGQGGIRSATGLGILLGSYGLVRQQVWEQPPGQRRKKHWYYLLESERLQELQERYAPPVEVEDDDEAPEEESVPEQEDLSEEEGEGDEDEASEEEVAGGAGPVAEGPRQGNLPL